MGRDIERPISCSWEDYAEELEDELDRADDEIVDLKKKIEDLEERLLFPAEEEGKR